MESSEESSQPAAPSVSEAEAGEKFAEGLKGLLMPIVKETDAQVRAVFTAQEDLQKEIIRLSGELEQFVEVTQTPSLSSYVQKLSNTKQRMDVIEATLNHVQARLNRLERAHS